MKNVRYGLALAALCSSSMLFSQGVVDALKYSQQDIRGTARYMGMAGAFGALRPFLPEYQRWRTGRIVR